MLALLQVLAVTIVALPMALSVAHALERPGKMRLDESGYRTVQRIYYPGFTIGGIAEGPGIIATGLLLLLIPTATLPFWLVLFALLGLVVAHAIYWIAIHRVNKHWMAGQSPDALGALPARQRRMHDRFFGAPPTKEREQPSWTALRDRWERSHTARAVLFSVSLLLLVVSLVVQS
jgi:hypothetical protein